jgi:hypothetical protein
MDGYTFANVTSVDCCNNRGQKRVKANTIYQEMVGDRNHTHMNSTKWETLSNFVIYLGKSGQVIITPSPPYLLCNDIIGLLMMV